jgi:hypothetical protein
MARLIKCPRCQAQIDVTTAGGGSTVKCPDCAVQVRVPSGETGKYQKVAEPAAAASAGGGGGKRDTNFRAMTPIMRKMAGTKGHGAGSRMPTRGQVAGGSGYDRGAGAKKGNNAPLIIGGAVAGVALIVVLIVVMGNNKPPVKPNRTQQSLANDPASDNNSASNTTPEPDPPPGPGPAPVKETKPALQKVDGKYVAPAAFERGASNHLTKGAEAMKVDGAIQKDAEDMLRAGKSKELQEKDFKFFAAILNCLLADDEALARKAFEWLRDWCDYKKLSTESGKNPINIELFTSAQWRGGCFMEWSEWYGKNGDVMDPNFANRKREVAATSIDWVKFASMLKSGGKGYDDEKRPEGAVMATLKGIKARIAVENLAKLMDEQTGGEVDLMSARGINGALEYLTGQNMGPLNASTVGAVKKKWIEWAASQP